jgi:hypothetical protein
VRDIAEELDRAGEREFDRGSDRESDRESDRGSDREFGRSSDRESGPDSDRESDLDDVVIDSLIRSQRVAKVYYFFFLIWSHFMARFLALF